MIPRKKKKTWRFTNTRHDLQCEQEKEKAVVYGLVQNLKVLSLNGILPWLLFSIRQLIKFPHWMDSNPWNKGRNTNTGLTNQKGRDLQKSPLRDNVIVGIKNVKILKENYFLELAFYFVKLIKYRVNLSTC